MQTEVIDEPGTDCGSKKTIDVLLTESNSKDFEFRYIVENGKYVELDREQMAKHIGKVVKMRTPMYCTGDHICNICAGNMNYKLNARNAGLGCSKIGTVLLQMGMKKFHISNLKSKKINVESMLI